MKREMSELETRVRDIVTGQNKKRTDAQISDDNYERLKRLVGTGAIAPIFELTQVEKLGLFDSILECLESGDDNVTIAKNVVQCFEDKLQELDPNGKEEVSPPKSLNSPIFRRSE